MKSRKANANNVGQASRLSSGAGIQMFRERCGAALRARQRNRRDACPTLLGTYPARRVFPGRLWKESCV